MQGFQDLFVAALSALVLACVIAKFVSVTFYGGDDNSSRVEVDANKVVKVVEQVNLGNAFRVRESRSKKKVQFVDDVVVRHVDQETGEEIKRAVFSGEEGVYGKGSGYGEGMKTGKDKILKYLDEEKVDEDGKIFLGLADEASETDIIGKNNDIANFDHHLTLETVNVTIRGNTEKVEILNNLDEPFSVKEGKLQIGGMRVFSIEDKVIKEETSTSGSVEGLMFDEKMIKDGVSSQSYVDSVNKHATLDKKEDNLSERLSGNTEGLNERDEKENQMEVLGENLEGGLSKKDEDGAMKNENAVVDGEDDDWEGIERTELEKVFAEAVNSVEFGVQGKDDHLPKLRRDVQMQLYGLHKIALEGPCHQAQPMSLNFFARAKWNAWQKLGSMSPEVAMEDYIKLLTEHFPEWVQHFYDEDRRRSSLESGIPHGADYRCSSQDIRPNLLPEPPKIEENSPDV